MKASTLFLSLSLCAGLFSACGTVPTEQATANVEHVTAPMGRDQVLSAQEPTQVLSANLSHQQLQVITTDHVQQAQFASQAEAPCDTCGNSIWKVFNLSAQAKLLTAFVAFLVLSAALLLRFQRHNRTITTH